MMLFALGVLVGIALGILATVRLVKWMLTPVENAG